MQPLTELWVQVGEGVLHHHWCDYWGHRWRVLYMYYEDIDKSGFFSINSFLFNFFCHHIFVIWKSIASCCNPVFTSYDCCLIVICFYQKLNLKIIITIQTYQGKFWPLSLLTASGWISITITQFLNDESMSWGSNLPLDGGRRNT